MLQVFIEPFCICFILECYYKVISINHDACISFQFRCNHFFEPPYQDIMHVNAGDYRRTDRTLSCFLRLLTLPLVRMTYCPQSSHMNNPLCADTVPPGCNFAACSAVIRFQPFSDHLQTCVSDAEAMCIPPTFFVLVF